jgi:hypothetical protein
MEVAMEGVGSGAKANVLVQVEGGTPFPAEVQIEVDGLDPENMPLRMSGVFTKLPTAHPLNSELASFSLHSDRSGGGSSHIIWFFERRHGYRFRMTQGTALDFRAEHQSVNPLTGRQGFEGKRRTGRSGST